MNCIFLDGSKGFQERMSFDEINSIIQGLVIEEENKKVKKEMLSNPYR